jgi:hypothetical protein
VLLSILSVMLLHVFHSLPFSYCSTAPDNLLMPSTMYFGGRRLLSFIQILNVLMTYKALISALV